jgi:hypothetical protein
LESDTTDWQKVTLYKYRKFDKYTRILFANRELYFSPPKKLNDPIDCQIPIKPALKKAISEAEKLTQYPFRHALMDFNGFNDHWLDKMQQSICNTGVFSLSRSENNALLWSHYANQHKGLCIGFRFSKNTTEPNNGNLIVGTCDCHYTNDNPFTNIFLELAETSDKAIWDNAWLSILSVGMVSKSKAWEPENEVRIVRKDPGVISFNPKEVTEVVFGLRMSKSDEAKVRELLTDDLWSHITLRRVVREDDGFNLAIVDADR